MKRLTAVPWMLLTLLLAAAAAQDSTDAADSIMKGKVRTDRMFALDATVDAPPEEVFRLWTTADGVTKFFGPAARIEPKVGGEYTLIFNPGGDPEARSEGTLGARILRYVPNKELAFEWVTFVGRENLAGGPPYAPPAMRDERPLPTWVELTFHPVKQQPGRTHIRLAHHGFRAGEKWDGAYVYFAGAWARTLMNLAAHCQEKK